MSNEQEFLPFPKGFATTAIHHSQEADQWDSMAIVPPLVTSTTFKQYGPAKPKQYEYGRSGNPTRNILEQVLANLDNAKYGLTFASGLATHSTLLGLFNNGDHVICGDDVYGGTGRLFRQVATKFGLDVSFVDFTNLAVVKNSIKSNTKLIWVETPTNPLMKIVDIKAAANLGKDNNIIVVVDNTFLTPYLQRPIDLGADIVIYSLSKYMNGHSDVIMGALTTSNEELYEKLKFLQNAMGGIPSPFDCYLVNRGLKTLAIRMQQHQKNGLAVAKFLEQHPKVEKVLYPGLKSHPQYDVFRKQTSGHSGTFSFYLKGVLKDAETFLNALNVFAIAESLGGYESLAELPSVMTHASVPPEHRAAIGITDNLIRLSVGIEDVEDLIADLEQAFSKID